jgi:exportin-1
VPPASPPVGWERPPRKQTLVRGGRLAASVRPVRSAAHRRCVAAQCNGIKSFIVNLVIARSSNEDTYREQRLFTNKLNVILVQIVKQEWPHNWPSFISDIVNASKTNETLCENNMIILKLLSEEVFDFSRDEMTSAKAKKLKESFNADFSLIFQLCEYIMSNSSKVSLLCCTFQTLLKFLNWIPLGYIFETQLLSTLVHKFFTAPQFRNAALDCLAEIASLTDLQPQYDPLFCELYVNFMQRLVEIVPEHVDIPQAYENGSETDKNFIQKLALFFTGYFKAHLKLLETAEHAEALLSGLRYLVRISMVPDNEVFQIALEYWHQFSQELYVSETQCVAPAAPRRRRRCCSRRRPRRACRPPRRARRAAARAARRARTCSSARACSRSCARS